MSNIRITVYYHESQVPDPKKVELKGLARRLNIVGLQPIPGDLFNLEDLTKEDWAALANDGFLPANQLKVCKREFTFGECFPIIQIILTPALSTVASSLHNSTIDSILF